MLQDSFHRWTASARAWADHARQLPDELLGQAIALPDCASSELSLLEPLHWLEGVQTLTQVLVPALPRRPPPQARRWSREKPILRPALRLFFRQSKVYRYRDSLSTPDPTPDQAWFFLNGVGTDRRIRRLNAAYLSELFGRPLTLLHSPTCGLLTDLAEIAVRRDWPSLEEAARSAFAPIYAALKQPTCTRVVVIAHSKGTIVASVLLSLLRLLYRPAAGALLNGSVPWPDPQGPEEVLARRLAREWGFPSADRMAIRAHIPGPQRVSPPLTLDELAKMELYCFANCAASMQHVDRRLALPFIENFANEYDPIRRIGVNTSDRDHISGDHYVRPQAEGHLLNAHYLHPMEFEWLASLPRSAPKTELRYLAEDRRATPRLFDYFGGASPPAWINFMNGNDLARVKLERMHWIEPTPLARAG